MWLAVIILFLGGVQSIIIHSVYVPEYAIWGTDVDLICDYTLEKDTLYSLKWYKDRKEIYRYFPSTDPPDIQFNSPGVRVDLNRSNRTVIHLSHVTKNSSGKYRCEVSADAPSFQTIDKGGNMSVIVLPTKGPEITGVQQSYRLSEYLTANCTTYMSLPRTNITWYINEEEISKPYYTMYDEIKGPDGRVNTTVGLSLMMKPLHFLQDPTISLRCRAILARSDIYDREQVMQIFRKPPRRKASLANSREMEINNNSGADVNFGCQLLLLFLLLSTGVAS